MVLSGWGYHSFGIFLDGGDGWEDLLAEDYVGNQKMSSLKPIRLSMILRPIEVPY